MIEVCVSYLCRYSLSVNDCKCIKHKKNTMVSIAMIFFQDYLPGIYTNFVPADLSQIKKVLYCTREIPIIAKISTVQ